MKVRLDTVELTAEQRRAINTRYGEGGWADRQRCKRFLEAGIEAALEDAVAELDADAHVVAASGESERQR